MKTRESLSRRFRAQEKYAVLKTSIGQEVSQEGLLRESLEATIRERVPELIEMVRLRYDLQRPDWLDRDRFIMSKGHACSALYAVLVESGYFAVERLETFYENGSPRSAM